MEKYIVIWTEMEDDFYQYREHECEEWFDDYNEAMCFYVLTGDTDYCTNVKLLLASTMEVLEH